MSLPSPQVCWFLVGIAFLALEVLLPGFVIFFFGVGAIVTAACLVLIPLSLNTQLMVFLISSLASLFALRGVIKKVFMGTKSAENEIDSSLNSSGEQAIVVGAIVPPAEGKIKYSGTTWKAVAEQTIEEGSIVTILSQDGLVMKVEKK